MHGANRVTIRCHLKTTQSPSRTFTNAGVDNDFISASTNRPHHRLPFRISHKDLSRVPLPPPGGY